MNLILGIINNKVLFIGPDISKRTKKILITYGYELINIPEKYLLNKELHIQSYRYILFNQFLKERRNKYENVMLSDIRDVFFQKDPFSFIKEKGLYLAIEEKSRRIADCEVNNFWIKSAYGESILNEIKMNYVSCSGTTLGDSESIIEYTETISSEILTLKNQIKGIDQGIHNYLIYKNKLKNTHFLYCEECDIVTVGKKQITFSINASKQICNQNNQAISIIHCYDRQDDLRMTVQNIIFGNKLIRNIYKLYYYFPYWFLGFKK